jgi:general secretion pathway protein E
MGYNLLMKRMRIGEFLVSEGLVRPADITAALQAQTSVGGLLGLVLVRIGAISENDLLAALSRQLGYPLQLREEMPSPVEVEAFITESQTSSGWWADRQAIAWRTRPRLESGVDPDLSGLVPALEVGALTCAAVNPQDNQLRALMDQLFDEPIEWRLAARNVIASALDDLNGAGDIAGVASDAARLRELAEEAPVIDFVNAVFAEALQKRASDVHVEPFEDRFFVRMRVDGILHTVRTAPRSSFDAVSSRIKLLSGMDIGERRLPQDGRQAVRISGQEIDLRVSALPASWGESLVLRLLGKTSRIPELTELGLPAADAERLSRLVEQPNGIVLVTGPTGSGKTTTIYRLLTRLNDGERKIVTVEDPVEFDLPGVVQVHVRSDIGLTFAAGLRSILRQDPDVIMVGEIRDPETARIAIQAALTGHMVISTVHTNSGLAAIARLLDLSVEEYLLADVMRGVVGQRLIRRLCPHCSAPSAQAKVEGYMHSMPTVIRERLGRGPYDWREPVGCSRCSRTGFQGRLGLYEISPFTPAIAAAVRRRAGEDELIALAREDGFLTMFEDGVMKAAVGRTAMSEIYRVIGPIDPELDHTTALDEVVNA